VFVGEAFETPEAQGTVGGAKSCRSPACNCVDLGDVVGEFELPRACEVTVHVAFSGKNVAGSGPLDKGDDIVGASVTGELTGGLSLPLDDALCGGDPCGSGKADADGATTFVVPVVGDSPELQIRAEWKVSMDGELHYYTGTVNVAGCSRDDDALAADIEVKADHASLGDLGAFIDSLGAGPSVSDPSPIPSLDLDPPQAPHCACRQGSGESPARGPSVAVGLGLLAFVVVRRRGKPCRNVPRS
jgi:hypothetical protein